MADHLRQNEQHPPPQPAVAVNVAVNAAQVAVHAERGDSGTFSFPVTSVM